MPGKAQGAFGPFAAMGLGIGIFFTLFVSIFLIGRLVEWVQEAWAGPQPASTKQIRAAEQQQRRSAALAAGTQPAASKKAD